MVRAITAATLAVLLAACGSKPTIDYDDSVDFNRYQRYQWLEGRSGVGKEFDPLLDKRVRGAIETALKARRFSPAGKGEADFLVRYFVSSAAAVSEPRSRGSVGLGSFGGNVGMGVSIGIPLGGSRVQQRAQILIDLLDPKTQELTWRGSDVIVLRGEGPEKSSEQIDAAVKAILDRFPPQTEQE